MRFFHRLPLASITAIALWFGAAPSAFAQTRVDPGFNLFSPAQDIEIGRQSAQQAERQMSLVTQPGITRYVSNLGTRLASFAPGARYPYQFRVANLSTVNAFALPGGYVYVHRGLLEKVRTEGELAGVMAHEIAHVALRHPTSQASRAYLTQAGLGLLGGLLGGRNQRSTGSIVNALGGFGMNALFLKYSRTAETQADVVGAQIMARAGYDPMEMVNFFETLRQQAGSNPGKFAQFLSDHPAPVNRQARVRQEAALLGPIHRSAPVGDVAALHSQLALLPPAPSAPLAQPQAVNGQTGNTAGGTTAGDLEMPANSFATFRQRQGLYELQYPSNWQAYSAATGYSVTLAPRGGVVQSADGRQALATGVIVSHYVPFEGAMGASYRDPEGSLFGSSPLEEATSDLVRHLARANPGLQPVEGSERSQAISGAPSFSVSLAGSSASGRDERVDVFTRELPDGHVIYMLVVGGSGDFATIAPVASRMLRTLRVTETARHP